MRKQVFYLLFVLSLVGVLGFSYISDIVERSPTVSCRRWGFISSKEGKYYSYPEKIVVEPWRGRHQVYGIFMIPDGYRSDHFVTLKIPGERTYCGLLLSVSSFNEGIHAKPGYYLLRGYFNTRVAIELILKGKGDQLEQPSNWRLGYAKQKQK
ncbi:hypothetical protein [Dendronalium sp. ChiSLP03b]|uniref:hypothetical protein n=1 Tax=Dendronalium sp. ChiSLP03b TaxID=3075381 RepID=UPI002AD370B6|nr:hypothetical protein [Dendronalium sp. ChiSLP03b]MDZ8204184.1 hypothetical protein [Dendronalium sp. ChiSLP03b]